MVTLLLTEIEGLTKALLHREREYSRIERIQVRNQVKRVEHYWRPSTLHGSHHAPLSTFSGPFYMSGSFRQPGTSRHLGSIPVSSYNRPCLNET